MTWQPIATEPKDGTRILIADQSNVVTAYWGVLSGLREQMWCCDWVVEESGEENPTHWQPLPEPPEPTP